MVDYSIENEYREKGFNIICGVDEAGRGPLAGPVYAAAVVQLCAVALMPCKFILRI